MNLVIPDYKISFIDNNKLWLYIIYNKFKLKILLHKDNSVSEFKNLSSAIKNNYNYKFTQYYPHKYTHNYYINYIDNILYIGVYINDQYMKYRKEIKIDRDSADSFISNLIKILTGISHMYT